MTTKEKRERENSRRHHNMHMEFIVQDHRYLGLIKSISKVDQALVKGAVSPEPSKKGKRSIDL